MTAFFSIFNICSDAFSFWDISPQSWPWRKNVSATAAHFHLPHENDSFRELSRFYYCSYVNILYGKRKAQRRATWWCNTIQADVHDTAATAPETSPTTIFLNVHCTLRAFLQLYYQWRTYILVVVGKLIHMATLRRNRIRCDDGATEATAPATSSTGMYFRYPSVAGLPPSLFIKIWRHAIRHLVDREKTYTYI